MTQEMYDKQYSFEELRSDRNGDELALARIRKLQSDIAMGSIDESKRDLLVKACDDILSLPPFTIQPGKLTLQRHTIDEILRLPDSGLPRYLVYRYRYETYPQTYSIDNFPPLLQIEPTSICNYRCVFCYQVDKSLSVKGSEHMGTMPLEFFKSLIDQAEGNIEAVTLASRGEPLLHPKIKEMLAYCRGKFLGLKINTNASKLTEANCHAILEADINTLVISADAAKEPLYSQLRVNGKLKVVLANVTRFHEIRAKCYPQARTILRVSGVRVSDEQNIDDMEGLWKGLVDQVSFTRYMPWERTYTLPPHRMQTPCSDLWRRMFVWWDGKVNPCDNDYLSKLSVGDANHSSIHELWTGQAYQDIRDKHLNAKRVEVSPCNRCNFT